MRAKDIELFEKLSASLATYEASNQILTGIIPQDNRSTFLAQVIESLRRVKFHNLIRDMDISEARANTRELFDPLKAAVFYSRQGNIDEAFWLIFLATHFGKSGKTGWRLATDFYWGLDLDRPWTWSRVSQKPEELTYWLELNYQKFSNDGVLRRFGNHRKYETLHPSAPRFTGHVIESYVSWIGNNGSHADFMSQYYKQYGKDGKILFRALYDSMESVLSFGRTAKFDYLTTLSNLGIVPITADSTYMHGATGPLKGARLLFGGKITSSISSSTLEAKLSKLDEFLDVGMQALEDSLCNWQKSPNTFVAFRG